MSDRLPPGAAELTQNSSMTLSPTSFGSQFGRFKALVQKASGHPFVSFHVGLPEKWESYKPRLRAKALAIMGIEKWQQSDIGNGKILESVIRAIEIRDPDSATPNNLVRWENRFGHANRSHRALLDARLDTAARKKIERWFFDFYVQHCDIPTGFEQVRALVGNRYDLIAYLFFLRDMNRFMPIAPRTFDSAFKLLGIDLVTEQKCSWTNYEQYNRALLEVRDELRTQSGIVDARLIDAHSFCWMLVRVDSEIVSRVVSDASIDKPRSSSVTFYDAQRRSIWEMANSVEQTVRNANGQVVERTLKNKELRMSRGALEAYIKDILAKQEGRCALTGIALQYSEKGIDQQLSPSLDRIDSNGHYEVGNLQVVCRFINFWKSDMDNEEFLRLLSLVRADE